MKKTRSSSDTAWKEVLDFYFKDFVDYCLPQLSKLIDWKRKWVSLDKELQSIIKGAESGKRLLDKLFRVYLKDGEEQLVFVHVEVQAKKEEAFPHRMLTYIYRIYDKYQKPVVSCAILTDADKDWRPDCYEVGLAGSYLSAKFLVVKMIDYQKKMAELQQSSNPFANVILAQLAALGSKRKPDEQRKQIKFSLTKRLYEKGFDKKQVISLYLFIDWLMGLPAPLELEYLKEVYELEESKKMPYISTAERLGMKKGMEMGVEKGIERVALNLIDIRTDIKIISKVTGLSLDEIKKLKEKFEH